jgi:hypothetical protein
MPRPRTATGDEAGEIKEGVADRPGVADETGDGVPGVATVEDRSGAGAAAPETLP